MEDREMNDIDYDRVIAGYSEPCGCSEPSKSSGIKVVAASVLGAVRCVAITVKALGEKVFCSLWRR